jgi:hypothetical protein
MKSEQVERYLNQIFTGQSLFSLDDRILIFKQPTNDIMAKANLIYDKAYNKAINSGMLPMQELEALIRKRNLFSEEDEDELEDLKSRRYALS